MTNKLNLLVTASGSAIAHGIIKSIKRSKIDCRIITTDISPYSIGLYRGDTGYLVPGAKDPAFIEKIKDICIKEKVNGIFVGTDYELKYFAEFKESFKEELGIKVFVSSSTIVSISDDKWLTYQFMKNNGFPAIPSSLAQNVDAFVKIEGFPLIVKPRIGDSSKDIFVVHSMPELKEKINLLIDKNRKNQYLNENIGPIIQKYLTSEDEEFTSTTAVFDGTCYGVISLNREMKYGGHTTKAIIKEYPMVNETIKKIAEKLNPYGPCNFQSRLINGVPFVFEINCRFSGTTGMCALVGFNTVEACIRKELLNEDIKELKYRRKGILLRYFNEVFIPDEDFNSVTTLGKVEKSTSEVQVDL